MQNIHKEKIKYNVYGLIGFFGFVLGICLLLAVDISTYNKITKAIIKNVVVQTYVPLGMHHKYFRSSIDLVYEDQLTGNKVKYSIDGSSDILKLKYKFVDSYTLYPEIVFFVPVEYTDSIKIYLIFRITFYFSFLLFIFWCINQLIFKIRKIVLFE